MNDILDSFKPTTDVSIEQILNNLLNSDKNLSLKTEIINPMKLASLYTLAVYLKSKKYLKTSKTIMEFIRMYLTYMVSNKRKSRNEVIKALTNLSQPNQDLVNEKV